MKRPDSRKCQQELLASDGPGMNMIYDVKGMDYAFEKPIKG